MFAIGHIANPCMPQSFKMQTDAIGHVCLSNQATVQATQTRLGVYPNRVAESSSYADSMEHVDVVVYTAPVEMRAP